jgi:hypothetical protein
MQKAVFQKDLKHALLIFFRRLLMFAYKSAQIFFSIQVYLPADRLNSESLV